MPRLLTSVGHSFSRAQTVMPPWTSSTHFIFIYEGCHGHNAWWGRYIPLCTAKAPALWSTLTQRWMPVADTHTHTHTTQLILGRTLVTYRPSIEILSTVSNVLGLILILYGYFFFFLYLISELFNVFCFFILSVLFCYGLFIYCCMYYVATIRALLQKSPVLSQFSLNKQ